MPTTDEIDATPGLSASDMTAEYEYTSTWALRGTEGRTIAKWQKDGWELDNQSPGTLRTEITFRRLKPKNAWQQCVAFIAARWSAFGRLTPMSQQLAVASAGALVVLSLVLGIVVASIVSGGTPTPVASTDPAAPSARLAETPNQAPTTTKPEPYVYQGVHYEVVVVDEDVSTAELTRYWVLTSPFDYSTDEYKNQIRMIVEDLARQNGTANLMVDVVTDREIAEAEAFSTFEAFIEEHGVDYAVNQIPKKEDQHWVASYTGGLDPNTVQPSTSADAYEVIWWNPGAPEETEQWKPTVVG